MAAILFIIIISWNEFSRFWWISIWIAFRCNAKEYFIAIAIKIDSNRDNNVFVRFSAFALNSMQSEHITHDDKLKFIVVYVECDLNISSDNLEWLMGVNGLQKRGSKKSTLNLSNGICVLLKNFHSIFWNLWNILALHNSFSFSFSFPFSHEFPSISVSLTTGPLIIIEPLAPLFDRYSCG